MTTASLEDIATDFASHFDGAEFADQGYETYLEAVPEVSGDRAIFVVTVRPFDRYTDPDVFARRIRVTVEAAPAPDNATSNCKHCGRSIVLEDGAWIDPAATGDDSVWRENCDEHHTFIADHEPAS